MFFFSNCNPSINSFGQKLSALFERRNEMRASKEIQNHSRHYLKGETDMLLGKKNSRWSFRPVLVLTLLTIVIVTPRTTRADVVTDWNQTAITSFKAANTRFVLQTRTLAMLHAAIFDAVN